MGPTRLYVSLTGEGYKTTQEECKQIFFKYKDTFKTAVGWLDDMKATAHETLCMANIIGRRRRWVEPNIHKIRADLKEELLKIRRTNTMTQEMENKLSQLVSEKKKGAYAAIEREGANFMVQSSNCEWTKDSMYWIRKRCKERGYDAKMYNMVYDEVVLDVASRDAEAVHDLQCKTMIECGQKYCQKVPVEVEGHVAPHWTK